MAIDFVGKGTPVAKADIDAAVLALGGDAAALWALVVVETKGFGFLPDRRPLILFERHIFHGRTGGKFSAAHPDISNGDSGGYSGGAAEYGRLTRAMGLDEQAALESASWGLGQVMGFNAKSVGFADARAMVRAMVADEAAHLKAVVRFITANARLLVAFKARDWATVARIYNGPDFAKNHYDTKLAASHAIFTDPAKRPDLDVRTTQACLTYLGFNPKGVDGLIGNGTRSAMTAYRAARGLAPGGVDATLLTLLRTEAAI